MFYISKEELEKLYFIEKMSYSEIEKKLNIKRGRIYHWFKKYNIKTRSQSEAMIGKKLTKEHKEKISKSNSKPHSEERKKNISEAHKGKKLSYDHKKSIREAMIGLRTGSDHPMWKGGISKIRNRLYSLYIYKEWRDAVYSRDKYTCNMCYKKGVKINAHHIETFKYITEKYSLIKFEDFISCDKLWDINNGITLCDKCHNLIRGKEKEFEEEFKKIVYEKENS